MGIEANHMAFLESLNRASSSLPERSTPLPKIIFKALGARFGLPSLRVTGKTPAISGKSQSERRTLREGLEEYDSKTKFFPVNRPSLT